MRLFSFVAPLSFALVFVLFGCECAPPVSACRTSGDCRAGRVCVDQRCVAESRADAGSDATSADAFFGVDACAPCGASCCGAGQRCTGAMECVADLGPCAADAECTDDSYCLEGRCAPYGTGPRGDANEMCRRPVLPGRFAPEIQCHWAGPAAGDPAPEFVQVFSTPVVVDFGIGRGPDDPIRPSVVFIAADAFSYTDHGVVRVIDGRTCADQAVFGDVADRVASASTPVVGNLDPPGAPPTAHDPDPSRPEIVAKLASGGLVAFGWNGRAWARRWTSRAAGGGPDPSAPSIAALSVADLDDDGLTTTYLGGP
jgi:hypothetical protein